MIWILRNISIHLWITALIAVPLTFLVLPVLAGVFPGINPITAGFLIATTVMAATGFLMDRVARKSVLLLIKEGQAWERSGILNKAEKNYMKALRLYDTFLFSPFSVKKMTRIISFAIAKFKLNTASSNSNFRLCTAVYLKMNPQDEDIACLWLAQLKQFPSVTSFEQEVLSLLVEIQYANKRLSGLMTDIFLGLERTDFIAQKLYQHVQNDPVRAKTYSGRIERLIGKPDVTLEQDVSFIQVPQKSGRKIGIGKKIRAVGQKSVAYLKNARSFMGSVFYFFIGSAGRGYAYIKNHEKARFYLKTGVLGIVSIWLLFFMINTLSHMFSSRAVETKTVEIEKLVPMPFTIQVAAYLKQKHADGYVNILRKKEIDARVKKVAGGGKTWFVVRVSKFPDKESATAYGRKLKQQGVIDDFFVNNR